MSTQVDAATVFAGPTEESLDDSDETFEILYVEDNPANIALMESIVGILQNSRLVTAHTAEIALALAEDRVPGVILLDVNLAGLDAHTALDELKSHPSLKYVPVIAVTNDANPRTVEAGIDAGFHAYITKPIDLEDLMMHLECIQTTDLNSPAHLAAV